MSDDISDGGEELILRTIKEESQRHAEQATARQAKQLSRRRIDWDVRGILALLALLGAFAMAGAQLYRGDTADIPAWAATTVGAIVGFYYGGGRSSNGDRRKDD